MSIVSLPSSNKYKYNLTQKRCTKLIDGIRQGDKEVALKIGAWDKIKDLFRNYDDKKKTQLKLLFENLQEITKIDNTAGINNPITTYNFPNIRAMIGCMAIHDLISDSENVDKVVDTLEFEKTSSGFDTGKVLYKINDEVIWTFENLLPVERAVLLESNEIVDHKGSITVNLSDKSLTQRLLDLHRDFESKIEDIQENIAVINARLLHLEPRIEKTKRLLQSKADIPSALKARILKDSETLVKLLKKSEFNLKKQPLYAKVLVDYIYILEKMNQNKLLGRIKHDEIIGKLLEAAEQGNHDIKSALLSKSVSLEILEQPTKLKFSNLELKVKTISELMTKKEAIESSLIQEFLTSAKVLTELLKESDYNFNQHSYYTKILIDYIRILNVLEQNQFNYSFQCREVINSILKAAKDGGHDIESYLANHNIDFKVIKPKINLITKAGSQAVLSASQDFTAVAKKLTRTRSQAISSENSDNFEDALRTKNLFESRHINRIERTNSLIITSKFDTNIFNETDN